VDENLFHERLLCLTYLTECPNAKNIYTAVKRGLDFLDDSTKNTCAVTADGAATMKSERNGVLSLFDKENDSDVFRLHCFVHQQVLVSKVINNTMDDVESIVKKAVISINISSILKNNTGSLCDTANGKHDVLLNYNHIHWLSFDLSVQRLCEFYDQVIITLAPKFNNLAKKLQQNSIRGCITFLKYFLLKLSSINLQLPKSNITIIDTALITDKLNNNVTDIISHVKEENDLSIFPALNAFHVEKVPEVKTEFKERVVNYLEAL
jgi:hypothetical protein